MLYIAYLLIILIVILVALGKIKPTWYLVFLMALALIWPITTHSQFLIGTDIHTEKYFAFKALDGWNISIPNPVNSAIGITLFTPFLAKLGISIETTFKWIIPAIFCLTPVILFELYKRYVTDKEAFLSIFGFVAFPTFTIEVTAISREMFASPFLALFFFSLLSKLPIKLKLPFMLGSGLLVIFLHYSLGLVLLAMLFMYIVFMLILPIRVNFRHFFQSTRVYFATLIKWSDRWSRDRLKMEMTYLPIAPVYFFLYDLFCRNFKMFRRKNVANTPIWCYGLVLAVFAVVAVCYYGNVAKGTPLRYFTALIPVKETQIGFLTIGWLSAEATKDLMTGIPPEKLDYEPNGLTRKPVSKPIQNPNGWEFGTQEPKVEVSFTALANSYDSLMQTALGLDFPKVSWVGKGFRLIQYVTQLLLIIGFFFFLFRFRRLGFSTEYLALALVSVGLLLLCVIVPGFSAVLNASRWYHISLFMLAPMMVIGIKGICRT